MFLHLAIGGGVKRVMSNEHPYKKKMEKKWGQSLICLPYLPSFVLHCARKKNGVCPLSACLICLVSCCIARGERVNLATQHPALVDELKTAALNWRAGIETRWGTEFAPTKPR